MPSPSDNAARYDALYGSGKVHLLYPAEWVVRLVALRWRTPGRVLDLGCGTGNNLTPFLSAGWTAAVAEVSETALKHVTAAGVDKALLPLDWTRLPWPSDTFDLILANQSLYYVHPSQFAVAIAECRRVLKPGGELAASFLGPDNVYASGRTGWIEAAVPPRLAGPPEWVNVLTREDLTNMFRDWRGQEIGYYDSQLPGKGRNFHWVMLARA